MKKVKWTHRNTVYSEWFERDRANVNLDATNGKTIICLWDDEVFEFSEGFKSFRQSWHDALIEYANDCQLIPNGRVVE